MSQPPPPPRRRNAPVVIYPGSPPAAGQRAPGASETAATPRPRPQQQAGAPRQQGAAPKGNARPGDGDRRRKLLIGLGAGALVILVIVVAVLVLGGGDEGKTGPQFEASTSVDLTAGDTVVHGVNPLVPIGLPPELRDQVLAAIGTYVDNGIVNPLRTGKVDDDALATTFDAASVARLAGVERAILFDEGLPKAVGKIKVATPPVIMNALADRDANIVLLAANFDLTISARAEKGTVNIHRVGSFVFTPDEAGVWKISGWTISITRTGPGVTPEPTTVPPTTAATG